MADKEGYNPYENRNVDSPISNFGAFVTLVKCVIGTGILALPVAFYYAGIVNGIVLLMVLTILLVHSMQLLIRNMVECSRRMQVGYATYRESLVYSFRQGPGYFRCWAKAGGYLVDGMLCFSHYGTCVVYIVYVSLAFKQIMDHHTQELDVRIYVAITGLLSIPLFLIRTLNKLVGTNLLGNVLVYFGFLFMFYYLFLRLSPLTERRVTFGELERMGLYFGIVLFSVGSVGVMLAVEAKMETPEDFLGCCGTLNMSIAVVMIMYVVFGLFGYWRYGAQVASSISFNLPTDQPVAAVANSLIAMAIFLTYPLSGYVVIDIIMNHYWNRSGALSRPKLKEYIVRVVFVLLTTLTGLSAPNLIPLTALIGAFSISLLNLIFPALMEICLYYPPEFSYGKRRWKLWKDLLLVITGTMIWIYGTYLSISEMIQTWGSGNDVPTTEGTDAPAPATTIADNSTIGASGATTDNP